MSLVALLSILAADPSPWLHLRANSDQRQPVYLGVNPRELAIEGKRAEAIDLEVSLRDLGEMQARKILAVAKLKGAEFELWPAQDDDGKITWAFSRRRESETAPWLWLDSGPLAKVLRSRIDPLPFIPDTYSMSSAKDRSAVLDDFLLLDDLYTKPVFGDCVWTSADGTRIAGAWLPPDHRVAAGDVCRVVPQPARFDGRPVSFLLQIDAKSADWQVVDPASPSRPLPLHWIAAPSPVVPTLQSRSVVHAWPTTFEAEYERDITYYSQIDRKSSAEPDNRLLEMASDFESRYRALGLKTFRVSFTWRGIPEADVIAVIPGSLPAKLNRPILLADHYDTAFAEDIFAKTQQRVSVPGADDNLSATATLLRAAEILRDTHPRHDIWLTHLTGEEFPGDDLGARHLVSRLLAQGRELGGVVLMDMIAYDRKKERLFQISAGNSEDSLAMAAVALDASRDVAPALLPIVRTRFDERSYLYNTDGLIFSDAGYPVILLNEHLNALENLNRPHYHQSSDTIRYIDWFYGTSIAKVAIETAARLSQM